QRSAAGLRPYRDHRPRCVCGRRALRSAGRGVRQTARRWQDERPGFHQGPGRLLDRDPAGRHDGAAKPRLKNARGECRATGREIIMGMLVNGVWQDTWYDTKSTGGRFVRPQPAFHHQVSSAADAEFPAEPDRYHLYVSLACPWAHRTLIVRKLKRLEKVIGVSVVHPYMGEQGWSFDTGHPGTTGDQVNGAQYMHQLYTKARPDYTGRVTVPVLWDKQRGTIVNNESSEIVRILNSAFDAFGDAEVDLYPEPLRAEIDRINDFVYDRINNGVYKAGFATSQ